jgi:hypothetical protein
MAKRNVSCDFEMSPTAYNNNYDDEETIVDWSSLHQSL